MLHAACRHLCEFKTNYTLQNFTKLFSKSRERGEKKRERKIVPEDQPNWYIIKSSIIKLFYYCERLYNFYVMQKKVHI